MLPSQLSVFISILFLFAFTLPIALVARLANKGGIKNGILWVTGFYTIYLSVVAVASLNGFFDTVMLPPKIVLTTTLPLAAFLTLLFSTKICKQANAKLHLEQLVGVHIFRVIGSFFIILWIYELLPTVFALIAGIGDVLTALGSIFVTRAIRHKKHYAKKLTFAWNTFGLVDILATSAMAILFTKFSIDNGSQGVEFLAEFPFCFIPAFAPATIIFLHLLVYRKLNEEK